MHGIVCTSVSPLAASATGLGLVSVVYILSVRLEHSRYEYTLCHTPSQ